MKALERVQVDKFDIDKAIDFETLEKNKNNNEFLCNNILNVEDIFCDLEKIKLTKRKEELFLNGVMLTFELNDGIYNIYTQENKYLGLGIVKNKLLKRDVILN